jgi:hypothetical protein
MRPRGLFVLALAALCLAVVLTNANAAEPSKNKELEEISQEKREEDEREDVTDKRIVERELAAELPGEEQFDQEQQVKLAPKPAGEEKAPEVELVALHSSIAVGGTRVKVRVIPHGSFTQLWVYLDWAKKCNTQVNCPTKGRYVHEASKLGTDSARPKELKAQFGVGECQVGEYVLTAVNRWGVARVTGWFGVCF